MNLEETRRKLLEMKNRGKQLSQENNTLPQGFRRIYPHWDMQVGESCILRFVPDGDENRTFFQEHFENPIPFVGTTENPTKPVTIYVPCSESPLYGGAKAHPCPIQRRIQTENWYKIESMIPVARKYYRRASFHLQGFVRQNPIKSDLQAIEAANNSDGAGLARLRQFVFVKSLFNTVAQFLEDPDLDTLPTDFEVGRNFRITVSSVGDYKNYSGSFSSAATPLLPEERAWIEKHGIPTISSLLPPLPSPEEQKEHYAMFEASLNGELLDVERFGHYLTRRSVHQTETDGTAQAPGKPTKTYVHGNNSQASVVSQRKAESGGAMSSHLPQKPTTSASPQAPSGSVASNVQELLARLKKTKASGPQT
jgi:hypothetical protein